MMRIALLHTRLRTEERLLLDAFAERGVTVDVIDIRTEVFDPTDGDRWQAFDLVLDRCVSLTASLTAVRIIESFGVRCVNASSAIEICSDKMRTTLALIGAGVATPGVRIGFGGEAGLAAVEGIGYPAVLKPTVGSWGRLLARLNDRDAAEAVVEHREMLGSAAQHVYYAQEHINKPGRDLRVFIVGGEAVAGIERRSGHWVTNTARGARTAGWTPTAEASELSIAAVRAVGADVGAVDLLECPQRGLLVNEVNHSMEFRNSIDVSGVDIPGRVADHLMSMAVAQRAGAAH